MIIPKKFKLFGQTITVKYQEDLEHINGSIGEARYRCNNIILQKANKTYPSPRTKVEQCFCHEVVHHMLQALRERELSLNEQFVDRLGSILHQFLTTSEGKLK